MKDIQRHRASDPLRLVVIGVYTGVHTVRDFQVRYGPIEPSFQFEYFQLVNSIVGARETKKSGMQIGVGQ